MILSFDLCFWSLISADFPLILFQETFKWRESQKLISETQILILYDHTLHGLCFLMDIHIPATTGHHPPRLLLHFFTVLTLPAPKISPPFAVSPIPSDGKYKQADSICISTNTRNANLPASSSARVREGGSFRCVLSTWTIFLYPKTCGNERSLWNLCSSVKFSCKWGMH